ncbi:hypothetical protein N8288_00375 [Flavobacteriaceae bacterium]|jgi:hypothetical protein|nr:hypothetical protein [Flavobacteriaceae bacterium]|tara:strand:- start:2606 stop:2791 length:186 start_codon:yes stop_codon:yes gene_type:complete
MSKSFNYCRLILRKVSFDVDLFNKELIKANHYLSEEDSDRLNEWLVEFYKKNKHLNSLVSD